LAQKTGAAVGNGKEIQHGKEREGKPKVNDRKGGGKKPGRSEPKMRRKKAEGHGRGSIRRKLKSQIQIQNKKKQQRKEEKRKEGEFAEGGTPRATHAIEGGGCHGTQGGERQTKDPKSKEEKWSGKNWGGNDRKNVRGNRGKKEAPGGSGRQNYKGTAKSSRDISENEKKGETLGHATQIRKSKEKGETGQFQGWGCTENRKGKTSKKGGFGRGGMYTTSRGTKGGEKEKLKLRSGKLG